MPCGSERNQDAVLGGKSYKSEKVTEEKKLMKWYEENNHHALDKKMHQWSSALFLHTQEDCMPKPKGEVNLLFGSTPNT